MATKAPQKDERYRIDGKAFIWTTEDGDDVRIPLRIKLKVLRSLSGDELDLDGMMRMIDAVIPDQGDVVDEMDVNDFQAMFSTWQREYTALSGASLGESAGSSN